MKIRFLFILIFVGLISTNLFAQPANCRWVIFGSLTDAPKRGICLASFDTISGKLSVPKLITEAQGPGFFVIHPDGKHLYSTVSVDTLPRQMGGAVSAYSVNSKTGELTFLNSLPSKGKEPCHISLDKDGTHVFTANYSSGNATAFSILPDGSLGKQTAYVENHGSSVNKDRQTESHAHSINIDPSGKFALVCDLGTDQVLIYRFDKKTGSLTPNKPAFSKSPLGGGPRHLSFHPNGKYVYVVNELLSTVSVYDWNAKKGELKEIQQISSLPSDFKGFNTLAEVAVYPNGKYLYCTNRGHNTVAAFSINPANGKLTFLQHTPTRGNKPRNFTFDPSNGWMILTNHESNTIVVYKLDKSSGLLSQQGEPIELASPFCVRFLK